MHNNTMSYKVISSTSLFTAFLYLTAILAAPIITNSLYKNIHLAQSAKFANKINSTNQAVATTNKVFTTEQPAAVSYIFDDQLVSRQFDNTNLQNYISDAKGSVLKVTDAATGTTENYSYDAYGNIITNPPSSQKATKPQNNNLSSTLPNSFQYNGERTDSNTTLQYLRARFYNPAIKRFLNQDDYALLNKFGYVGANPVMLIDSSGHEAFNPFSSDWWKQTWNSGALGKAESLGIAFGASIALGGIGLLGYKAKNRITSRNTANAAMPNRNITTTESVHYPAPVEYNRQSMRTLFTSLSLGTGDPTMNQFGRAKGWQQYDNPDKTHNFAGLFREMDQFLDKQKLCVSEVAIEDMKNHEINKITETISNTEKAFTALGIPMPSDLRSKFDPSIMEYTVSMPQRIRENMTEYIKIRKNVHAFLGIDEHEDVADEARYAELWFSKINSL